MVADVVVALRVDAVIALEEGIDGGAVPGGLRVVEERAERDAVDVSRCWQAGEIGEGG